MASLCRRIDVGGSASLLGPTGLFDGATCVGVGATGVDGCVGDMVADLGSGGGVVIVGVDMTGVGVPLDGGGGGDGARYASGGVSLPS